MIQIPVGQGRVALVDDEDACRVEGKWEARRGKGAWYAMRKLGRNRRESMHRAIVGDPGAGMVVDHINGNGLDNRRCNLRVCTVTENNQNKRVIRSDNTSGFKGVQRDRGAETWRSVIQCRNRQINVGEYRDVLQAALAYNAAASRLFGEFARLNPIPHGPVRPFRVSPIVETWASTPGAVGAKNRKFRPAPKPVVSPVVKPRMAG